MASTSTPGLTIQGPENPILSDRLLKNHLPFPVPTSCNDFPQPSVCDKSIMADVPCPNDLLCLAEAVDHINRLYLPWTQLTPLSPSFPKLKLVNTWRLELIKNEQLSGKQTFDIDYNYGVDQVALQRWCHQFNVSQKDLQEKLHTLLNIDYKGHLIPMTPSSYRYTAEPSSPEDTCGILEAWQVVTTYTLVGADGTPFGDTQFSSASKQGMLFELASNTLEHRWQQVLTYQSWFKH